MIWRNWEIFLYVMLDKLITFFSSLLFRVRIESGNFPHSVLTSKQVDHKEINFCPFVCLFVCYCFFFLICFVEHFKRWFFLKKFPINILWKRNGYKDSLHKICQNASFLSTVFFKILALYGIIRFGENPYSGVLYAVICRQIQTNKIEEIYF